MCDDRRLSANEIRVVVRGGGSGPGGVKYDDAARFLGGREGYVLFSELATHFCITEEQADQLARDLLLSRHAVGCVGGFGGKIELEYRREEE